MSKPDKPTEGWGVMRPGDRRYHYYRDQESLCRRVGFYRGDLEPDSGKADKLDCAACRRAFEREAAQRARTEATT